MSATTSLRKQYLGWLRVAGAPIAVVLLGQPKVINGERIAFGFDRGRALWFDAAGEQYEA